MFKTKLMTIAVFTMTLVASTGNIFAHEHKHETSNVQTENTAVLCPVSGEKIEDNTGLSYEYEGKDYTLCCADCLASFKKNPGKYLDKDEAHAGEQTTHHEGHE